MLSIWFVLFANIIAIAFCKGLSSTQDLKNPTTPKESVSEPGLTIPYHVAIRTDKGYVSSGAILSKRWVITSAHTLFFIKGKPQLTVVAGTSLINGTGQQYRVESTKIYPKYNFSNVFLNYDVALLKTADDIRFGLVRPIALPTEETGVGQDLLATGWKNARNPQGPDVLQAKYVTTISNDECKKQIGFINEYTICTKDSDNPLNNIRNTDFSRDAGGPLVKNGKLVGVITQFYNDLPYGFSARVYKFLDWIKETIQLKKTSKRSLF